MYEYGWYFFLYAFFGWCGEVVFAAVKTGRFVNRGFLYGPVCPIYGFGVTAVVVVLAPVADKLGWLYLGSVVLTSAIELVTGWLMEKLFAQKWWDYSSMPFNIGGYVCLAFSLAWGIFCVLIVRVIHPLVAGLVAWIPHGIGVVLLGLFGAVILFDLGMTLRSVAHFNRSLGRLDELAKRLEQLSCRLGEEMSGGAIALREKAEPLEEELLKKRAEIQNRSEALKAEIGRRHARMLKAFPGLQSKRHPGLLEQLKAELNSRSDRKTGGQSEKEGK